LKHSVGEKSSRDNPMPSHGASTVRWAILRNVFLHEAGFGFQQARIGGQSRRRVGENLFYRVQARTVGGQQARRRPGGFDGFSNAGAFTGTKTIHHHDFARRQGRHQNLRNVGQEPCAIDGTVVGRNRLLSATAA
jgi:hypothetical protein